MVVSDEVSEREQIRSILAGNIERLDARVQTAWNEELAADEERLQLTRLRTLGHLARQYRLLVRDEDIDEMEADVDLLQEAMELQEGKE